MQQPTPRSTLTPNAQILYDLVTTPSFSGQERAAAEVFVHHAAQLGLDAHIDAVGNAIATRCGGTPHSTDPSTNACVQIALLGHIDTVTGYFRVRIEEGDLYARGSVDAKGPLAAMLIAAANANIPPQTQISIIGAVGEEAAGSIGARHIVDQFRPDACIIGEPSGADGVTLGYKGRLLMHAHAQCPNTHSAGQQPSACDQLCMFWANVQRRLEEANTGTSRAFDQIQSTIGSLDSTSDGLTQHARCEAGFRLPVSMPPSTMINTLREIAQEQSKASPELTLDLQFDGPEYAYATDRADPVVRALSASIRAHGLRPRPKLKTGTADLNVVAPIWRCPIAAYGPGDSALDHTPNEHLSLDEFEQSIKILTTAIESLAAELLEKKTEPALCQAGSE